MYQSAPKANVLLDVAQTPCALLLLFTDRSIDISRRTWKEKAEVNVFFLTDADLDFDGLENQVKVDDMADKAENFIGLLMEDGGIAIDGTSVMMRQVYDEHDRNLTGVSLQFSVTEVRGRCIQLPQPNEDNK